MSQMEIFLSSTSFDFEINAVFFSINEKFIII
jgi:hypothetical protein